MRWLKRHLTEIFCILFLTAIVGVVAMRNYTPGTFLTGIDNFHIEFDLGLALSRAWSGVWQENQGVGIVSGLAQMTEIPRVTIYQVLSWVMPMNLIRYVYVFGNLYLGAIGMFFLAWYLSKSRLAGLAGALFYLFNLGTLQVFFMPTDMFVVNYAALPWLFLSVFKYLSEGRRANLLWYAGLFFIFTPMAMTPTIFVVYLIFLGIVCVGYKGKRAMGIVGVTMGMSMYFLLPFANFAINKAKVLTDSKINSVFSQENYLMNAGRTSWNDLTTLKGMWFDYPDNVNGQLVPLLGAWNQYLVGVGMWLYVPIIFIGIGIIVMLWKKRWQGIAVVVTGVVSLVLLRGENPPIGDVIAWLRSLPLVAEAFRTPYTKMAPILTLVYAVCFGYGIYALGQVWRFKILKSVWKGLIIIGIVTGLIWLNLLYFQGKLISEGVRVKVPSEYFEMFKFFQTQDKSDRVVRMPVYSSQAWDYTSWGYRGSGFLWYGIEQPILDRAFDVWSPYNEGFYNEFSNAIYSCNPVRSDLVGSENGLQPTRSDLGGGSDPGDQGCKSQIKNVLDKYDVRYVLLDESVIAPGQDKEILRIEETKKLASELGWIEVFKENFLTVWSIPARSDLVGVNPTRSDLGGGEQGISAPGSYTWAEGDTSKVRKDVVFEQVGTYVSNSSEDSPFAGWRALLGLQPRIPFKESPLIAGDVVTYPFAEMMREEIKGVEYGDGVTTLTVTFEETPPAFGVPTRASLGSPVEESPQLIIPGWKLGDIVRIEYATTSATAKKPQWETLPAYYVNGQSGPKFLGKENPKGGQNIIYARVSDGPEWKEYLTERRYRLQGETLKVEVPGEPQIYDFGKEGKEKIENCDVLKRGTAEKIIPTRSDLVGVNPTRSDLQSQGTSFVADGRGAACDYVVMKELDSRLSYLMRVQGENKEGRSLKFFLYNTGSKRNDIEWLMSGRKSQPIGNEESPHFDQTFSLLPWAWDGYYTLNIETRSFGQRAENRIAPVEVRWFPMEQIAGAKVVSAHGETPPTFGVPTRASLGSPVEESPQVQSSLRVTGVKKYGTWLYRVKVEKSGLLKLSQGFDNGWISVAVGIKPFAVHKLEHVKVNGWSNGWMIGGNPKSQILQFSNGEQKIQIWIFYWPQMLEYFGFGVLGLTLVWIWRMKNW